MIDVSKCVFEGLYESEDYEETTLYFIYPKELSEFPLDEVEGKVVNVRISLTVPRYPEYGESYMQMSPSIMDEERGAIDVDWHDLVLDVHYTESDVNALMHKAWDTIKS